MTNEKTQSKAQSKIQSYNVRILTLTHTIIKAERKRTELLWKVHELENKEAEKQAKLNNKILALQAELAKLTEQEAEKIDSAQKLIRFAEQSSQEQLAQAEIAADVQ